MHRHAQLDRIEALIAALKGERGSLERRLVLLRSHRDLLDVASRWYFNLWRLKWDIGVEIFELPPAQRELLENLLGHNVIKQHLEAIEGQLFRLISKGHYITFAEIEGLLQVFDGIIERLEKLRGQVAKRERPALQRAKKLAGKAIHLCGGAALIGVDLPVQSWPSVIVGAVLILSIPLNDK